MTTKGRGNLVSCVFLLDGAKASCDVQVVMARKPGATKGVAAYAPSLLYNLAVPSAYGVVRMEAILPHEREAGLPGRVNLLQEAEPKGAVLQSRRGGGGEGKEGKVGGGGGWFGWLRGKRGGGEKKDDAEKEK